PNGRQLSPERHDHVRDAGAVRDVRRRNYSSARATRCLWRRRHQGGCRADVLHGAGTSKAQSSGGRDIGHSGRAMRGYPAKVFHGATLNGFQTTDAETTRTLITVAAPRNGLLT